MLIACETVFTNGRGASYHSVNHQMDDRLSLSNGRCILYRYTAAASTTNGKHSEDTAPQAREENFDRFGSDSGSQKVQQKHMIP